MVPLSTRVDAMEGVTSTVFVAGCLDRLRAGDAAAIDPLIERTSGRFRRLAGKLFADFPRLHRWETVDDVCQNAVVRLWKALKATVPESPPAYFRLATVQVRRELIDLARHYFGPQGAAVHQESYTPTDGGGVEEPTSPTYSPSRLAEWTEFHAAVEKLPEPDRDVFELIWYHGLNQAEIADMLAVDIRTVQRRWRSARLGLHDHLIEEPRPE